MSGRLRRHTLAVRAGQGPWVLRHFVYRDHRDRAANVLRSDGYEVRSWSRASIPGVLREPAV